MLQKDSKEDRVFISDSIFMQENDDMAILLE